MGSVGRVEVLACGVFIACVCVDATSAVICANRVAELTFRAPSQSAAVLFQKTFQRMTSVLETSRSLITFCRRELFGVRTRPFFSPLPEPKNLQRVPCHLTPTCAINTLAEVITLDALFSAAVSFFGVFFSRLRHSHNMLLRVMLTNYPLFCIFNLNTRFVRLFLCLASLSSAARLRIFIFFPVNVW